MAPRWLTLLLLCACAPATAPTPAAPEGVRHYQAGRASAPPEIDGKLNDAAWRGAQWSESFVDIEGSARPLPTWATRFKLAWDCRVFLCRAGDWTSPTSGPPSQSGMPSSSTTTTSRSLSTPTAMGSDISNSKSTPSTPRGISFCPSRTATGAVATTAGNRGAAIGGWTGGDAQRPERSRGGWTLELAIPWRAFSDSGRTRVPPRAGEQWRVNFSRVEWDLDVVDGRYVKRPTPAEGKHPEHNWVWSPQGEINMHAPEPGEW